MDLDNAKENIQPLAGGRNIHRLEVALNAENNQALQEQRQNLEGAILNYKGEDPLESWFDYILWIEQSYPSGGRDSGLEEVILRCLATFENDARYMQDRRMIQLYIKYIDTQPNPQEFYQELYNRGIGTMVADLYICWAYYYDLCNNFSKADSIFRKGLDARAQPFDELDQAHKHFGFTMSQRLLYKDETSQQDFMASMQQRRHALTSLRAHKKKVGSIRTGTAVKSENPGRIQTTKNIAGTSGSNIVVPVFEDQNHDPNQVQMTNETIPETPVAQSLVRSIIDSARKQENLREPGPWSKARVPDKRKGSLFDSSTSVNNDLGFEILEDDSNEQTPFVPLPKYPDNYSKGIQLPPNFIRKNDPQPEWKVPVTLEPDVPHDAFPCYDKFHLYPQPGHVYSPEELAAYKWFKKRSIPHKIVKRQDPLWSDGFLSSTRLFPNFVKKNLPQPEFKVERFLPEEVNLGGDIKMVVKINEIYPPDSNEEFQFEQILSRKWKNGERELRFRPDETITMNVEMDETQCVFNSNNRKSRKSFAPSALSRKSIAANMLSSARDSAGTENNLHIQSSSVDTSSNHNFVKPVSITSLKPTDSLQSPVPGTSSSHDFSKPASVISLKPDESLESPVPDISSNHDFLKPVSMTLPKSTDALQSIDFLKNASMNASMQNDSLRRSVIIENPLITSNDLSEAKNKDTAVDVSKFEIYQDNEDEDCLFKKPSIPIQQIMTTSKPIEIFEDETEDNVGDGIFGPNETCSTQTFNFFIQTKFVSTPKNIRKSHAIFPTSIEERPPNNSPLFTAIPCPISSSASVSEVDQINSIKTVKQLSTIMEITELSASTKSSVEGQISSPECDTELNNLNVISTNPFHSAKKIQEKSFLQQKEDTIPSMMMSMKLFEEKTETVPRTLLQKPTTESDDINFGADVNQQNLENENEFLNFFMKTPEKKLPQKISDDSMTFSNFRNFTLPKLTDDIQDIPTTSIVPSLANPSFFPQFEDAPESLNIPCDQLVSLNSISKSNPSIKPESDENIMGKLKFSIFEQSKFIEKSTLIYPKIKSEDNIKTDIFTSNMSSIKNSTWLSNFAEKSIHIKDDNNMTNSSFFVQKLNSPDESINLQNNNSILGKFLEISKRQTSLNISTNLNIDVTQQNPSISAIGINTNKSLNRIRTDEAASASSSSLNYENRNDDYFNEIINFNENDNNKFHHEEIDLNSTRYILDKHLNSTKNVNPFDLELIKAFLEQVDFCNYIEQLENCSMVKKITPLKKGDVIRLKDIHFDIIKIVAEGSYGKILCGKERKTGEMYAFKQEKPANLWEYYICLEIKSRIIDLNMLPGFMDIDYAIIGNNASILICNFSKFGTLIGVCNKFKHRFSKNLDEYIVMILTSQMLSIIDHLHAIKIIHADIKPDNFLLTSKLTYGESKFVVQLIDFGVSIDMELFSNKEQTFLYSNKTQDFKCIEMLEGRPWTYQIDLFGLAGTIHVLLFGKYMEVEKQAAGWGHKSRYPRYINKILWDTIFSTLLNILDCKTMPNLQNLRLLLDEEIMAKEKYVKDKINEFNVAID